MGRGRAKAKQTKVARQLKYGSVPTDLGALQAELGGSHRDDETVDPVDERDSDAWDSDEDDEDEDDPYAKYYTEDDDEDDEASAR